MKKYDFRMVQIGKCLNETTIALSGHVNQVNKGNAFKFCPECGEKLETEKHCPNCNVVVADDQKFCLECGSKL